MAWASPNKARFGKRHLAMIAALSIPLGLSATYAMSIQAAANSRLQEVADNAALAGVNALVVSSDQPADARSQAAIAAARASVTLNKLGVVRTLSPSVDGLTMSVIMEDRDKGTRVSATAHYIPPKDARPSQEAANWLGSSRVIASRL